LYFISYIIYATKVDFYLFEELICTIHQFHYG